MHKLDKHIPYIILLLGVIGICFLRYDRLSDPYFWDEMGVYAYGVQHLFEHGISILPSALPPEISRGHPLLFYAIHALVLRVFENSFFVSHVFALIISIATVVSTYLLAKEFLPKTIASFAALLFASTSIFLAQSTLLIPEMLISLMSTSAILLYFKKKYFWLAFILSLGVLVKESMIISAGFIGVVYLIEHVRLKNFKFHLSKLLLFSVPLWVFLIFLGIQKIQNGWYFFPYHTDIVKAGALNGFQENFETHYKFIFYKQGRNQWIIAFALAMISILFVKQGRKLLILFLYFFFALGLFSFAFYMDRYLLFVFPILVIIVCYGIHFIVQSKTILSIPLIAILIVLSLSSINNTSFRYDVSLAYQDVVDCHLEASETLCELAAEETSYYANFPINMSLWESKFGYIDEDCRKQLVSSNSSQAEYVLLYNELANNPDYVRLQQFQKNEAQINLYKKNTFHQN